jgi:AcrR family transcriptional regulator
MKNQKLSKRVSKADWLEKALEILETEGIDYVKIERLSKELNVSRSGFYWHFENRQALINEMIKYWGNEFTSVVTSNKKLLTLYPKERLYRTIKIIIENNLTQLELPMRACAETDPVAKKLVNQVYQMRLEFIRSTLTEMGFEGEDLEMRTHLSKAKRLRWLKLRLELICTPSAISN